MVRDAGVGSRACRSVSQDDRRARKGSTELRRLLHGAFVKWSIAVALAALLAVGGLAFTRLAPVAHGDAFDGCHAVLEATAKASGGGYTLTVNLYARFATPDFGGGYCGTMLSLAQIAEPANGAGGTLTTTVFIDSGSVTSSTTTGGGGSSGATFTVFTTKQVTKCGSASGAFTSTAGLSLSATTKQFCVK
jgi:hypothetical protein